MFLQESEDFVSAKMFLIHLLLKKLIYAFLSSLLNFSLSGRIVQTFSIKKMLAKLYFGFYFPFAETVFECTSLVTKEFIYIRVFESAFLITDMQNVMVGT